MMMDTLYRGYRTMGEHKGVGEKHLPKRSGFFISYKKRIFWIFVRYYPFITIGMNTATPEGTPPRRFK
jgi:hypothetical protein